MLFSGVDCAMRMLSVLTVPAFEDNYLWLIHDGKHAAAVDPGDAVPILAALEAHRLKLAAILLTHHHADHVGGLPALLRHAKVPAQLPVFGPRHETIPGITHPLAEGDAITVPYLQLDCRILDVPGHTRGHIAYYTAPADTRPGWLFCGDTLFAGGCGRLFEGTPEQMSNSLGKLAALPDETQVFCAHEYTLSNLRFAREIEPHNPELLLRIDREADKRDHDLPTVPSSIGLEKSTNPFLRCREPAVIERVLSTGHATSSDPVAVFAALREWKNVYR
jgi:hydroxyacylglutathione hydrolase